MKSDGLPSNQIRGIIENGDNNLWIITSSGLSNLDISTGEFENYNTRDGLLNNEFNVNANCTTKDGLLFLGGYNGIDYFNPANLIKNTYTADILITGFRLLNGNSLDLDKPIEDISEINLPYSDNSFTISFAAMDFISPMDNKYAYKMIGFDDNWTYCDATDNSIRYTT
jgi:hypothetical protein